MYCIFFSAFNARRPFYYELRMETNTAAEAGCHATGLYQ
jgi:hypothetical protein